MAPLDNSLGAALLGNLFSAILFGVTITQACTYFRQCVDDRRRMKFMVAFLMALDTAHLGLITYGVYTYLITHFGILYFNPEPSLIIQIIITSINNLVIRMLFALRVWRMTQRNRVLLTIIVTAIFCTFAGAMVFAHKSLRVHSFWHIRQFDWVLYTTLSIGAFVDILMCGSLCLALRRSRTGWARTDSLISSFSLYAINTGVLVSMCSILTLLMFALLPDTMGYIAVYFCMDSIFFNALLASLNARARLRERLGIPSLPSSRVRGGSGAGGASRRSAFSSGIVVKVETSRSGGSTDATSTADSPRKPPAAYTFPPPPSPSSPPAARSAFELVPPLLPLRSRHADDDEASVDSEMAFATVSV